MANISFNESGIADIAARDQAYSLLLVTGMNEEEFHFPTGIGVIARIKDQIPPLSHNATFSSN